MYVWIWRHLPGPLAAKVAESFLLFAVVASLLLFLVFPWLDSRYTFPWENVTVPAHR